MLYDFSIFGIIVTSTELVVIIGGNISKKGRIILEHAIENSYSYFNSVVE